MTTRIHTRRSYTYEHYGRDGYTADELHACFIHAVTHGDPSQEARL